MLDISVLRRAQMSPPFWLEESRKVFRGGIRGGSWKEDFEKQRLFLGREQSEQRDRDTWEKRIEILWRSWKLLFIMVSERQFRWQVFRALWSPRNQLCAQSSRASQRPLAANCSSVSCDGLCEWGRGCLGASWLPWCCFHRVWQSALKYSTSCLSRFNWSVAVSWTSIFLLRVPARLTPN